MVTKRQEIVSKIAYYIFYVAVIVEVLLVLIDKSAYTNPIEGRIFQITFLLFLIKVCLTKYSWKEYLAVGLFLGLGLISDVMTERNEIIRIVMFIAACKNVDMKKCLKIVFFLTLLGCAIIISLSVTGIYGAVALTQDYGRGGVETRYILGMGHPNALQCMIWALTTLGLYLYGEKMKWYYYPIILGVNVVFFLLTDSKTSLLVTMFIMVLAFFNKKNNSLLAKKIVAIASIVVTVMSILLSVLIAGNAYRIYDYIWNFDRSFVTLFLEKLNRILNGRIRILVENDRFEGTIQTWTLFSRPENNYYFDMGWVRLFYWYGIIPAVIFVVILLLIMLYCYRKRETAALIMIASFALYSVIEAHAISVYIARNYVFFLVGMYWYNLIPNMEKVENGSKT